MNHKSYFLTVFAAACAVCILSCTDDTVTKPTGCQCEEGQVCSGAGICYDNPDCKNCRKGEICVGGECFGEDSACADCTEDQICRSESCFDADDPCLKCEEGQTCVNKICYNAGEPCAKCTPDQACVNNICYDADNPCFKCSPDQACVNKTCYGVDEPCFKCAPDQICTKDACFDKGDPCAKCKENQICMEGVCVAAGQCYPSCAEDEMCVEGECRPCPVVCGGVCCGEGQLCDIYFNACEPACSDGRAMCAEQCCAENEHCEEAFGCVAECGENETRCENPYLGTVTCCAPGTVCEENTCKEDCGEGVRCNEICCAPGQVCEENTCKIACDAATHTRCGTAQEFCCDNASEVCIYNQCMKRTKSCTKDSSCAFDEFCEESTKMCINTDLVPTTCEVRPKFGTFAPLKQWHWPSCLPGGKPLMHPKYTRVIVMPMTANFTDDNNDGVVNVDDVPDVVFISYPTDRGPDHQGPNVLRIISGDDGHEIASSEPHYWTYPIDAVVADIDNDGKIEIILGTNHNHSTDAPGGKDYLEAVTVDPDPQSPTNYSIKTKYQIEITPGNKLSFLSVADIDADGTPEVLTNYGVASVVDGQFKWREGCENRWIGYPHAADLDGDGKMELVTSSAILDDHCNRLTGIDGGHIAIADLMPNSADAAQTGELVPETAHVIGDYNQGHFYFNKIYKTTLDDGSVKWSSKRVWEAPIPIDPVRAAERGCRGGREWGCSTGGGTPVIADFNGDGFPDIGVASRYYYIVYSNDGTPTGGKVLWADGKTQDYSSAVTGSSVFDFEGDGKAEVVYADETKLHIYSGEGTGNDKDGDGYNDPKIIWEAPNYNWTGYEYPIVADIDNDGSTEIVLSSDHDVTEGVTSYEDPGAQWVRTRRIWNQHHYHVTNINEDGSVPQHEIVNWTHPKLNNYRQNVQPGGLFNAPNLIAKGISSNTDGCSASPAEVLLTAKVSNGGSLGIKAGLKVKFYVDDVNKTGKSAYIGTAQVPTILTPESTGSVSLTWDQNVEIDGQKIHVNSPASIRIVVDEPTDDKAYGEFVECIEDDNTVTADDIALCVESVN